MKRAPSFVVLLTATFVHMLGAPNASAKSVPLGSAVEKAAQRSRLTEAGGTPFHLKAELSAKRAPDPQYTGEIEEWWESPGKWRRAIHTPSFSQTLIVNGSQVSEQDSGDYFSGWLRNLATELVDPVPPPALEHLKKLDISISEPSGGPGMVHASWTVPGSDGVVSKTVGAGLAIDNKTGLLLYGVDIDWDAAFDDYKKFRGKQIARQISAGTPQVTAKITELDDLNQKDDRLFSISQATPPEKRINTVVVPEIEERKLAVAPPAMHWPPLNNGVLNGLMVTEIEVDRAGNIRHIGSIVSDNGDVAQAARDLIAQWHFKPYLVDGIPVQVLTTLTFPFQSVRPGGALDQFGPAKHYFDHARALADLRTEGSEPFHLKATFDASGYAELLGTGTYEETWLSPTKWRREAVLGNVHVVETRNGGDRYLQRPQAYTPRRIDDAFDALWDQMPGTGDSFYESDWRVGMSPLGTVSLLRVIAGYESPTGALDPVQARAFYFDPGSGLLRACFLLNRFTTYNNFKDYGQKPVARDLEQIENRAPTLKLHIEDIEKPEAVPNSAFVLANVTPTPAEATEEDEGKPITPPKAIKQVEPDDSRSAGRKHGEILVNVNLDRHGHVRSAEIKKGLGQPWDDAAVRASLLWEFSPMIFKGQPVGVPTTVKFQQ